MLRPLHLKQQLIKFGTRYLSAQPSLAQDNLSVKLDQLSNGLKVATFNEAAPTTQIALLVKSGSRDDTPSTLGVTHCLQSAAGLTCNKNTAFLTTQLVASLGADLQVSADREHTIYTVRCAPRDVDEVFGEVVIPTILGAKFPWWEVATLSARMRYQKALAEADPCFVLMENVHKASFKGSLGNPVLSPDYMIGKHTTEMLRIKYDNTFTPNNMVLAGTGLSHDALLNFGSTLTADQATLDRSPSEFLSSEVHVGDPAELVHAAITFQGVALNNNDAIALTVLKHALGTDCQIKRGSGLANGMINAEVAKATESPFSTRAFSVNYSDNGLFGLHMVAPSDSIAEVTKATSDICKQLAMGSIPANVVDGAKQRLKSSLMMCTENSANILEDIVQQTAVLGSVPSMSDVLAKIDAITPNNVTSAARKIFGGKKSLVTVGRGDKGPYLQDL